MWQETHRLPRNEVGCGAFLHPPGPVAIGVRGAAPKDTPAFRPAPCRALHHSASAFRATWRVGDTRIRVRFVVRSRAAALLRCVWFPAQKTSDGQPELFRARAKHKSHHRCQKHQRNEYGEDEMLKLMNERVERVAHAVDSAASCQSDKHQDPFPSIPIFEPLAAGAFTGGSAPLRRP